MRSKLRATRRGFTLVELLVVMVIITMLASIAMVAMWGAQEEARIQRTRAQIAKIHEILLPHFEAYTSRPVRLPPNLDPISRRQVRLLMLRDLMRLEFPDRQTDLLTIPLTFTNVPEQPLPQLRQSIQRRLVHLAGAILDDPANPRRISDPGTWSRAFEQAECLYLILSSIRHEDRDALSYFRDSEIGDFDEDGVPEILDGWGHPISFLRWAPGYSDDPVSGTYSPSFIQLRETPDPFDPLRIDPRWNDGDISTNPFFLFPLVFSAGPNAFITNDGIDYGVELGSATFTYYQPSEPLMFRMDPFRSDTDTPGNPLIGIRRPAPNGERVFDNLISNHDLESS